MKRRLFSLALALAMCCAGLPVAAQQPAYPAKPIRLLVPSTAGGGIDLLARMFAQRLAEQMGQPVVVDNVGGAGGTIAAGMVARAEPDGYTLIFQATTAAVNAAALPNLPYDPVNAFAPVSLAARFPLVLVVNPKLPAKDLPQFVEMIRKSPGKHTFGSAGVGTGTHLAAEWLKVRAGLHILHIPYKGTGAVMPDLLSGAIDMLFDGLPPQLGNIRSGKVRVLAVTTATRSPLLPDVPAMGEVVPGFDMPFWAGIFAPAKTPRAIVEKLALETRKAATSPQLTERLRDFGAEGVGSTPAEFDAYWKQQVALYGKVIKDARIKIDAN
jgi:tripartite-type tricarboxylate transporter receptor subunit TctC